MMFATISTKGRITIPAAVRRQFGLKPGGRVFITEGKGEIVLRPVPDFFALRGCLGKALTLEQEEEAIMDAAVDHAMGKE